MHLPSECTRVTIKHLERHKRTPWDGHNEQNQDRVSVLHLHESLNSRKKIIGPRHVCVVLFPA